MTTNSRTAFVETMRSEIELLTLLVIPDEIPNLNMVMDMYKGREEELLDTLRAMHEKKQRRMNEGIVGSPPPTMQGSRKYENMSKSMTVTQSAMSTEPPVLKPTSPLVLPPASTRRSSIVSSPPPLRSCSSLSSSSPSSSYQSFTIDRTPNSYQPAHNKKKEPLRSIMKKTSSYNSLNKTPLNKTPLNKTPSYNSLKKVPSHNSLNHQDNPFTRSVSLLVGPLKVDDDDDDYHTPHPHVEQNDRTMAKSPIDEAMVSSHCRIRAIPLLSNDGSSSDSSSDVL